ncbi:phage integrase family protein [Salinisphaera dokdonensis CL-ES53]|uniref:Phage integrase family protein n=1 Tax=Salinisphaera dokdonensis CL-ES53 TaxID=1304272 RepID=A0ABV2AZ08_9GAMM
MGIHRNGRQLARLSGRAIDRIVKLRAEAARIDVSNIGAHSLRVGFLTEAGRRGISLTDAMEMSRHRTLRIAMDYYERGRLERNAAVDLLNDI